MDDFDVWDDVVLLRAGVPFGGYPVEYEHAGSCGKLMRHGRVQSVRSTARADIEKGEVVLRLDASGDPRHSHWKGFKTLHVGIAERGEPGVDMKISYRVLARAEDVRHAQGNVNRVMPLAVARAFEAKNKSVEKMRADLAFSKAELRRLTKLADTAKNSKAKKEHETHVWKILNPRKGSHGPLAIAARELMDLVRARDDPALFDDVVVVPVKDVPVCVARYDVVLREAPLRAAHAMHTILTRMVMFRCTCCNERFPTFHPAFRPPESLGMEILKRGKNGAAACDVAVHCWEEPPPLLEVPGEGSIAQKYRGLCVRCHVDIEAERRKLDDEGGDVVPLRSFRNRADPYWNFPRKQFESLFKSMTVPESMLVALDWMQVNVCTVRKTRMDIFENKCDFVSAGYSEFLC